MDATSPDGPPGLRSTRLGRAVAFAGIVWAVALSFVGFELVLQRGMDLLLARPSLAPSLALSRAAREARTCVAGSGDHAAVPADLASSREARLGAWLLGLKLGRDALARQYPSVDRDTLAAGRADAETLAQRLGVPVWSPFTPRHAAAANTEFIAFVESDPSGTARQLATAYQPGLCHLYKLGALWGYASLVRPALAGDRAPFAAELRHHALEAGLPAALWAPMLEGPPRRAPAPEIAAASAALTQRVSDALMRPPQRR
jgi:hypothetical protein